MTAGEVSSLQLTGAPARAGQRRDRLVVAGFTLLAFALRAPTLGRRYWIDEGITVGIASHHLTQIPGLLRLDGSPPLFYLLLHGWMRLFGTSEVATHFLPLLVSLAVIPVAFWAGRELFDRRAAVAAAALTATSPFLGWYSTETRMYTLVCLESLVALTFTLRAVRDRRLADASVAVVAFAALLYTHNWGLYLAAVTAATLIVGAWRRGDRHLAGQVVLAGAAALLLWLPWLPSFVEQARTTAAPWAVRPNPGDFFADPTTALGGTLGFLVGPVLVGGVWSTRRLRPVSDGQIAGVLGAIGLGTAVLGWLAAQIEPSWTVRYLAVVVSPFLLGAAGALASSRRGRRVVVAVCVGLAGWSVIGSLLPDPGAAYAKSNAAAIAKAAAPFLAPGDVVVVTQTEQLAVLHHYLPPGLLYVTPTGPVSDPTMIDWRNLVARLQRANDCATVGPEIAALPPGGHVLEVDPVVKLGAAGSTWSKVVNGQVASVDYLLANDPSLRAEASFTEGVDPRPYSAVVAELFRKQAGADPCAS